MAKRLKAMGSDKYQRDGDPRTSGPGFGLTVHQATLNAPYTWRAPRLVFVNSMSDLFHARVPEYFIREVFRVMSETPQHTYQILTKRSRRLLRVGEKLSWPANVWMGVSVEHEKFISRVDDLRATHAQVKFLSCEPLLGPLNQISIDGIDWVIVGGESGPNHRPMEPDWARLVRDRCKASDVPFFFKQWGGKNPKAQGRLLDGEHWDEMPRALQVV